MSSAFMLLIALLYFAAMVSYAIEAKWAWALVALCWGAGNAVIAYLSR